MPALYTRTSIRERATEEIGNRVISRTYTDTFTRFKANEENLSPIGYFLGKSSCSYDGDHCKRHQNQDWHILEWSAFHLLFWMSSFSLSSILNSPDTGHTCRNGRQKINHPLYIDDPEKVQEFNRDIHMHFALNKCAKSTFFMENLQADENIVVDKNTSIKSLEHYEDSTTEEEGQYWKLTWTARKRSSQLQPLQFPSFNTV